MDALYVVALLACPAGMGLCMWLMMRGRHGSAEQQPPERDAEIQRLRAEVEELRQSQRGSDGVRVD